MLTLEIPLLLALAARVGDHLVAVAGLGLALGIIVPINAAALALCTTASVANAEGWAHRAVLRYTVIVGVAGVSLLLVISSGLFDAQIETALGLPADTWDAARWALVGLLPAPMLVALRRYTQGYLIAAGDTACFMRATLARMLTSVLLAGVLTQAFGGGTFGIGVALTIGVAVECALLWFRHGSSAADAGDFGRDDLWAIARVHVPLSGSMLLTVLPPTAVLLLLGASDGDGEALAAWPVLYGLAWLISGTTIDLEPITASNHRQSRRSTQRFAIALAVCLTGLLVLLRVDTLAQHYFRDFSGLSQQTADIAVSGLPWLLGFPALCVTREWMRGALVASGRSPNTIKGVGIGFVAMLAAYLLGYGAWGLAPIQAAAMSVLVGAACETAALSWLSRRPAEVDPISQTAVVAAAAAVEESNPEALAQYV